MNLSEKLTEAQYIHRGENGKYISDQCGFGCDHSYLVNNDDSGRPCYRMCRKLGIRVDDYDSCKYFSNDREMDLIRQYAATIKREPGGTQSNTSHPPVEKKKSGGKWLLLIVVIAVICYCAMKYF